MLTTEIEEKIEYEVIKACCGENENGKPKVTITTAIVEYYGNPDDKEAIALEDNYKTKSSRIIHNGVLNIEIRDGITMLDVRFNSYLDPELRLLWDLLETFGQSRFDAQNNPDTEMIPHIFFDGLPEEFSDKYILSFTDPMLWFLQPKNPEDEQLSVIRMFFLADNFVIQDISETINVTQTQAEAMRPYDTIYTEKRQ